MINTSDAEGIALVHVIMGSVPDARYEVNASAEGLAPVDFTFITLTVGDCNPDTPPGSHFSSGLTRTTNSFGQVIEAGIPGAVLPVEAFMHLIVEVPEYEDGSGDDDPVCIGSNYVVVTDFDTASITVTGPGGSDVFEQNGTVFEGDYPLAAGVNTMTANFTATYEGKTYTKIMSKTVYGVTMGFVDDQGAPVSMVEIPVSEDNLALADTVLNVAVEPAEYTPGNARVVVYEDDDPVAYIPIGLVNGRDTAEIARGSDYDEDKTYTAGILLNNGSDEPLEMETPKSERLELIPVCADIDADLYRTGVFNQDDPDEHTIGLIIQVNNDDDDENGISDIEDYVGNTDGAGNLITFNTDKENDLTEVKLAARLLNSKITLEASTSNSAQIKVWDSKEKDMLLVDLTDTDTDNDVYEWPVSDALRRSVYVEGLATSGEYADIDLTLKAKNEAGDTVASDLLKVTVIDLGLIPDYNRDGNISEADRNKVKSSSKWLFWVNDDEDDNADAETGESDESWYTTTPYDLPGQNEDNSDNKVNGVRDLVDFFPVCLDLGKISALLPADQFEFRLSQQDKALNLVMAASGGAAAWLKFDATNAAERSGAYLIDQDKALQFHTQPVTTIPGKTESDGYILSQDDLAAIASGNNVLLFEGITKTEQPLVLEIVKKSNGRTLMSCDMPLQIVEAEEMYRHKNFRGEVGGTGEETVGDRDSALETQSDLSVNKDFVLLHGYNTNEKQAQAWHAEMFKRLFWSGNQARFHAVTWYGDDGRVYNKCPNYHDNVAHAFQTAPLLEAYLDNLTGGQVVLAAHSLGNMVACEAVMQNPDNVERYFMLNAAVASEAIDATQFEGNMLHSDWVEEYDMIDASDPDGISQIYAANWYKLFANDAGDLRKDLTWRGRFASIAPKIINVYSSGDQVFESHPKDDSPDPGEAGSNVFTGRRSWVFQEKLKGHGLTPGGTEYTFSYNAGWSINCCIPNPSQPHTVRSWVKFEMPMYRRYIRQEVLDEIINTDVSVLKTKPFFGRSWIFLQEPFGTIFTEGVGAANAFLSQEDNGATNIHRIISGAIPAMSLAVGRVNLGMVNGIDIENINMNESGGLTPLKPDFWPIRGEEQWEGTNWYHSDIKNMSYLYTNRVFKYLVDQGGLK